MSDKTWCPGCDSMTSSLTESFNDGWPCPVCNLANETWREVVAVRAARNDDELAQRYSEVRIENSRLKRELAEAKARLQSLRSDIQRWSEDP